MDERKRRVVKAVPVCMLGLAALFYACTKEIPAENNPEESTVFISISPQSKASGEGHGVQQEDNVVQTLELFIFRNEGVDAGVLDTYKKISGPALSGLSNLEVKTTTGKKLVYAVANSHKENWAGVNDLTTFKRESAFLGRENLQNFTMSGCTEAVLQVTTSLTLSVSRLAARIILTGIRTRFAGTPYEGSSLKNVKIYLTNVVGKKGYSDGEDRAGGMILNYKQCVTDDVNACILQGMLYDAVYPEISDAGYTVPHYFYCYENRLPAETSESRFTRLVVQGDLNGHTYYYPVNINREAFGSVPGNDHSGIRRNTSYSLEIVILRPGSLDPDEVVEHGTLTAYLNILDWNTVPVASVEF